MSATSGRRLPANASLEYLRKDAKDRLAELRRADPGAQLSQAQFAVARAYGFASWRALKTAMESPEQTLPAPDDVARRRADQALPRIAAPFDPRCFDRFAGTYLLGAAGLITVSRQEKHFFLQVIGQVPVEIYPESDTKFFAQVTPFQVSFRGAGDAAFELVMHQMGHEKRARRIAAAEAAVIEAALARRLAENLPAPGTQDALRHHIARLWEDRPDYAAMTPALAATVNQQMPVMREYARRWGPLVSLVFRSPSRGGLDIYIVDFQNEQTEWRISVPDADGLIGGLGVRHLP